MAFDFGAFAGGLSQGLKDPNDPYGLKKRMTKGRFDDTRSQSNREPWDEKIGEFDMAQPGIGSFELSPSAPAQPDPNIIQRLIQLMRSSYAGG